MIKLLTIRHVNFASFQQRMCLFRKTTRSMSYRLDWSEVVSFEYDVYSI